MNFKHRGTVSVAEAVGGGLTEMLAPVTRTPLPDVLTEVLAEVPLRSRTRMGDVLDGMNPEFVCIGVGALLVFAAIGILVAIYLLKSVLGINVMDGPSPFHSMFFN